MRLGLVGLVLGLALELGLGLWFGLGTVSRAHERYRETDDRQTGDR